MEKLNRIKIVLAEKNMTGRVLAEKLAMNEVTISKWCRNFQQPDLKTLYRIADALNVNTCALLVHPNPTATDDNPNTNDNTNQD